MDMLVDEESSSKPRVVYSYTSKDIKIIINCYLIFKPRHNFLSFQEFVNLSDRLPFGLSAKDSSHEKKPTDRNYLNNTNSTGIS